ncbi:MAG: glutaredoxin 3 [Pseudohongiellaceae bacterium]
MQETPGESRGTRVVMYSTQFCPFCIRARALLKQKQVPFRDLAVDGKPALRQEMIEKSGHYTVPQIWVGEVHIGGCDELMQLERRGELDALLAGDSS